MWWSILAITIAGWAISVGVIYYPCAIPTLQYETGEFIAVEHMTCLTFPSALRPIFSRGCDTQVLPYTNCIGLFDRLFE